MAAKKAIKILRDFFKEQEKESMLCAAEDDELVIEEIIKAPNPGVAEAKQHGISITIAEGNTIYKIGADDSKEEIGTVSNKDVRLKERRFSLQ